MKFSIEDIIKARETFNNILTTLIGKISVDFEGLNIIYRILEQVEKEEISKNDK